MLLRRLRHNRLVVAIVASVLVAIPLGIFLVPNRLFPDFRVPNDPLSRGGDNKLKQATEAARRGDHDLALKLLDSVLQDDPTDNVALFGRSCVRFAKEEYDQAIDDLSRAIELRPHQ